MMRNPEGNRRRRKGERKRGRGEDQVMEKRDRNTF